MTSQTRRRVGAIVRAGCLAAAVAALTVAAAVPAATTWTLSKPQIPQVHSGNLTAESCRSAAACIAVGFSDSRSGPAATLAEAWNGTAWRALPTPNPAGNLGSNLDAVSCPSATACTAVGTYVDSAGTSLPLAEAWNGTTWSIKATPNPPTSTSSVLDGVSCTAANACTAVGSFIPAGQSDPVPFAEGWNGATWRLEATPLAGFEASLLAVSCTAPSDCMAVGDFIGNSINGDRQTLAEHWNGTSWAVVATVDPTGSVTAVLNGISCTAAGACTAVGYFEQGGISGKQTLAERWNGTAWALQQTPTPGGTAGLAAVSCTGASACTAVGSQGLTQPAGLAEAWNGTTWAVQPTPVPANAFTSSLAGVSCAAGGCGAVGSANTRSGTTLSVAEARTGSTWALQATVNPLGAESSSLNGVSCTSATACVAVGLSTAQGWNGTRWRDLSAARPPGASSIDLSDVSCATATACMAVGFSNTPSGGGALAESWNGTAWTIRPPALPSGSRGGFLNGVSCAAPNACLAVGSYFSKSGTRLALAETWNGAAWTVRPVTQPANSDESELNGVSCTAASSCVAVGDDHLSGRGTTLELAEAWNGTAWSIQPIPGRSGTRVLGSVSCTAPSACAAVGFNGGGPLAETWDGTTWTADKLLSPKNSAGFFLNHVSCVTASDCTAVGDYSLVNTGFGVTAAEVWNGTTWQPQHTVGPSNTEIVGLTGISCMASGACTAVGGSGPSLPSQGAEVPLAEQRH